MNSKIAKNITKWGSKSPQESIATTKKRSNEQFSDIKNWFKQA